MTSELAKTLNQELFEFDLRIAGLATVSKLLDLNDLHGDLSLGIDVVGNLAEELSDDACARKAVKQMLHSACLGRYRGSLRKYLLEDLSKGCAVLPDNLAISKVLANEHLKIILLKRKEIFDSIEDRGGIEDCFGRWLMASKFMEVKLSMAPVIQST